MALIGIRDPLPIQDEYYQYYDYNDASSIQTAVADLERYIASEGPFDAVMAYSMGAALAATLMIQRSRQDTLGNDFVFKCAIFISGSLPYDCAALAQGNLRMYQESTDGAVINIPTANIWGLHDAVLPHAGVELAKLCNPETRTDFLHHGGHQIPSAPKVVMRAWPKLSA